MISKGRGDCKDKTGGNRIIVVFVFDQQLVTIDKDIRLAEIGVFTRLVVVISVVGRAFRLLELYRNLDGIRDEVAILVKDVINFDHDLFSIIRRVKRTK